MDDSLRPLAVNGSHRLEVDPSLLFCPSGIEVVPGAHYRFEASGKWKDGFIIQGPGGWHGFLLQARNRLPWKPFFLLCGTVGQALDHAFPIGQQRDWIAPPTVSGSSDRQLYFFANDWPGMYWNNRRVPEDPLTVTITRSE